MNLDIRDLSIINEFPILYKRNDVLTVGCGKCRMEKALVEMGLDVLATDVDQENDSGIPYQYLDILDPTTFPKPRGIVICSQVLEHIKEWKTAFANLIRLAEERLIVTVPVGSSFYSEEHVNMWLDPIAVHGSCINVEEFSTEAMPYSVAKRIIITKPEDRGKQYNYVIVVDKNQILANEA